MHEVVCQPPQQGAWAVDPPIKATPIVAEQRGKGNGREEEGREGRKRGRKLARRRDVEVAHEASDLLKEDKN